MLQWLVDANLSRGQCKLHNYKEVDKWQVIILPGYESCQLTSENIWKSQCMKKESVKIQLKTSLFQAVF